jgi:mono/diheme cytochrome c family protein
MADNHQDNNSPNSSSANEDHVNRGGLIAFLFSMAFVILFFIYISFLHPGIDLKENIQAVPTGGANLAAAKDPDVSKIAEPWVPNDDMVVHGKKVFMQNCQMCHGPEGHGDGPAGMALNPHPRNLVKGPWKKGGGFIGWFTVVTHGLEGTSMASFAHLKTVDRWAVVQFINSITEAKVQEDPAKVAEFAKQQK